MSWLIPEIRAGAHCDIPCGIYEPTPAKIAAQTVKKMVAQIGELKAPATNDQKALDHYHNAITRRVNIKEEHAEICKRELSILWSDFFKPEHLEKFPDLHEVVWKALKLCSKNKQEVSTSAAEDLVKMVDEIARMFYGAKGIADGYTHYQALTDTLA